MQPMQHPSTVVRTYSTNTFGRAISAMGSHHFVVDHAVYQEGPGEQPGPIDYFLSGLTACGVLMLERRARQHGVPLDGIDVQVEAYRRETAEGPGPTTLKSVTVRFEFTGPTEGQAQELVDFYKRN